MVIFQFAGLQIGLKQTGRLIRSKRKRRVAMKSKRVTDKRLTNRRVDLFSPHPANHEMTKGEDHRTAKMTEEKIHALRKRFLEKRETSEQLGKLFGVAPSTAAQLITGKVWRHLKLPNLRLVVDEME